MTTKDRKIVTPSNMTGFPMQSEFMDITPAMARQCLQMNRHNRPINMGVVARYARDMKAGAWHTTGQGILFDIDGNLLSGQHRLQAAIETNTTFRELVVQGLDPQVYKYLDIGRRRSPADALRIGGYSNANTLAAGAGILFHYLNGNIMNMRYETAWATPDDIFNTVEKHPGLQHGATVFSNRLRKLVTPAVGVFVAYILRERDEQAAMRFIEAVSTGENLKAGMPAYVLREQLLDWRNQAFTQPKENRPDIIGTFFKAWNEYRGFNGKVTRSQIRFDRNKQEAFPSPI